MMVTYMRYVSYRLIVVACLVQKYNIIIDKSSVKHVQNNPLTNDILLIKQIELSKHAYDHLAHLH